MAARSLILKVIISVAYVSACLADTLSRHVSGGLRSDSAAGEIMSGRVTPRYSSIRTSPQDNAPNYDTVVMTLSDENNYPSPSAKGNAWRFDLRQVAGYNNLAFSVNGAGIGTSVASNCAMCAIKRIDSINMIEDDSDRASLRLGFGAHTV